MYKVQKELIGIEIVVGKIGRPRILNKPGPHTINCINNNSHKIGA